MSKSQEVKRSDGDNFSIQSSENNQYESDLDFDDEIHRCGYFGWRPKVLQFLARPAVFLATACCLCLLQSVLVSGYLSSILTTIEKRYNFRSSHLGLIVSSYEFSCMPATLLVSYFAAGRNRAYWVGVFCIVLAAGGCVFTLPHFLGLSDTIEFHRQLNASSLEDADDMCIANHRAKRTDMSCKEKGVTETWALHWFLIGQVLIGLGCAPIYTLIPTYLHDNVKSSSYSAYAGVFFSMTAVGPAIGFLMGAYFVSIYVIPDEKPSHMTESDPRWIGAWWIGYFICSGLILLISVPLLGFPTQLPLRHGSGDKKLKQTEELEDTTYETKIRDLPGNLLKLLRTWPWLFITLAFIAEESVITTFVTYIAKYLQSVYSLPASAASVVTGAIVVPSAGLGILCGGLIMKKLQLNMAGLSKFLMLIGSLSIAGNFVLFFLGCPSVPLIGAGTFRDYFSSPPSPRPSAETGSVDVAAIAFRSVSTTPTVFGPPPTLSPLLLKVHECSVQCGCSGVTYRPVCGANKFTYYSPCHAGCQLKSAGLTNDVTNYTDCSCVILNTTDNPMQFAKPGKCEPNCDRFLPFVIILFLTTFVTCLAHNPVLLITLRSVDVQLRTFAYGMQNFLIRLFAFIPAPIYFGVVFDTQCLFWDKCKTVLLGSCIEYDSQYLPYAMFGLVLIIKVVAFVFIALTYAALRIRPQASWDLPATGDLISELGSSRPDIDHVTDISVRMRLGEDDRVSVRGMHHCTTTDTVLTSLNDDIDS